MVSPAIVEADRLPVTKTFDIESNQLNEDLLGNANQYPIHPSFYFKVFHTFMYLVGGVTFTIGSDEYYPTVTNLALGGYLYTIGAGCFFVSDVCEWWINNRIGCFYYSQYAKSYEKQVPSHFHSASTIYGQLQRAELGLNFFLSACGQCLYVIGSAMYIPSTNDFWTGNILFIYGSVIIVIAQLWKLYRAGCYNAENPKNISFSILNFQYDVWWVLLNMSLLFGGFGYLVGAILFLPQIDNDTHETHDGAAWFIFGGISYFFSFVFIFLKYFMENKQHNVLN